MKYMIDNNVKGMSHIEILHAISRLVEPEQYNYVILGESGPTGKTWLCKQLKKYGLNAAESDTNNYWYRSHDYDNYMFVYPEVKTVVIILNRIIIPRSRLYEGEKR